MIIAHGSDNPLLKASENKKKVIVFGMYLSMGVKNMAEN